MCIIILNNLYTYYITNIDMKSFLKKKITYKQMPMNSDSYLIECPICFNESYDIHICNKCSEAWCLNCHNKLLQSKLIKKEGGQYYY